MISREIPDTLLTGEIPGASDARYFFQRLIPFSQAAAAPQKTNILNKNPTV